MSKLGIVYRYAYLNYIITFDNSYQKHQLNNTFIPTKLFKQINIFFLFFNDKLHYFQI